MTHPSNTLDVYLEVGKKRTFACAIDWPGWARMGRDEESALEALATSGARYAQIVQAAQIAFEPFNNASDFNVIERLDGNSTTDFGAPDIIPSSDLTPIDDAALQRFQTLLKAYWQAFDEAIQRATGKELSKGPRGGGRDLDEIIEHVLGADGSYLGRLAWKFKKDKSEELYATLERMRLTILEALTSAVHNGLPEQGPRGGAIWKPRYFVRRVGWHVLDHVWEIEDRIV